VTQPRVEEQAEVPLTREQQRACGGKVVGVAVKIGQDGNLLSKRVISSVSPMCDALALDVVSRSTFQPARDDRGGAAEGRFVLAVPF
jgi:outer membrane biosynthesis protein TonB